MVRAFLKTTRSAGWWYRFAAEQGHAEAQFHLGRMHDDGRGVAQDDGEAVRWYRLAADQGVALAQFFLGRMYAGGRGISQDDVEAARWIQLAAEQGAALAQLGLGLMYSYGRAVPQDDTEAVRWVRMAAESDYAHARFVFRPSYAVGEGRIEDDTMAQVVAERPVATARLVLGHFYEHGKGIVRNLVQAHVWYSLALSRFPASEQDFRDEARRSLERIASQLDPAELAEAQILARKWGPGDRVAQRSTQPEPKPSRRPLERESTGSGFRVSAKGHILTNAHVVRGCTEVRIPSVGPVRVLAREESSDLALLQTSAKESHSVAKFRQGRGIRPGASIIVVGYPLRGLLTSGASVSTGAVSALAGPGDDRRLIQISAPIQPGNSGGPVLDTAGNVVGVVVAKLDALEVARSIGDIPQNVNFAISAGSARAFLDDNGVPYETAPSDEERGPVEVAATARQFTMLVECWN